MLALMQAETPTHSRYLCDCGKAKLIRTRDVVAGNIVSCGCSRRQNRRTHGGSRTPAYASWYAMMQRCYNPAFEAYVRYGAQGITVWDGWHDFAGFVAWMGSRPEDMTLDRINGAIGYNPFNCRWATPKQQAENRKPWGSIQSPPG